MRVHYLDWIERQVSAGKFEGLSDKAKHYWMKVHSGEKPTACPKCGGPGPQFWSNTAAWMCRTCALSKQKPGSSSTQFKPGRAAWNKGKKSGESGF